MSNLNLSLVAGYDVDSPALTKPNKLPRISLAAFLERMSSRIYARERARHESEIGRFVAANGGVLTDELERAISRRFGRIVG